MLRRIRSPSSETRSRREAGASEYAAFFIEGSDARKYRVSTTTTNAFSRTPRIASPTPTHPAEQLLRPGAVLDVVLDLGGDVVLVVEAADRASFFCSWSNQSGRLLPMAVTWWLMIGTNSTRKPANTSSTPVITTSTAHGRLRPRRIRNSTAGLRPTARNRATTTSTSTPRSRTTISASQSATRAPSPPNRPHMKERAVQRAARLTEVVQWPGGSCRKLTASSVASATASEGSSACSASSCRRPASRCRSGPSGGPPCPLVEAGRVGGRAGCSRWRAGGLGRASRWSRWSSRASASEPVSRPGARKVRFRPGFAGGWEVVGSRHVLA